MGQDRAVPASAWRKGKRTCQRASPLRYGGVEPPDPIIDQDFPAVQANEEERSTLGHNTQSPRLSRVPFHHSRSLGWQAARAQCCTEWCYPNSYGVVCSDSRRFACRAVRTPKAALAQSHRGLLRPLFYLSMYFTTQTAFWVPTTYARTPFTASGCAYYDAKIALPPKPFSFSVPEPAQAIGPPGGLDHFVDLLVFSWWGNLGAIRDHLGAILDRSTGQRVRLGGKFGSAVRVT